MIKHPAFEVDSWTVQESHLDLDALAQTESVLALSNGHIGLRANLDEGEPSALPGTYLNGFYEEMSLPYPESAYGYPEAGQIVVNATDGKVMRLLVDDEPFDVRYGRLVSHQRVLDFRDGVLRREVEWESPAGRVVRVSSTRLVSFTQRAVAAILYEVEAVRDRTRVVVQSELVANEPMPATTNNDPRSGHAHSPLKAEEHWSQDNRAVLVHTTAASNLRLAAGMDHVVEAPDRCGTTCGSDADLARVTVAAELTPGQRLRVVKFLAYGWSRERSAPALRDQVEAALASARYGGWDGLLAEQRAYLADFWNGADVKIDGDAELQQAVRFALFHVLQSSARAEKRAIPAKGLTGPGYDGHTFWDTETFVLPVLTYTAPHAVADELRWRHSTLPQARERARQLGHQGAAFPWRTIHGEECSGYWPASTAAFHINADIADAVVRYQAATGDETFELEVGLELLVETARLWRSLGHHDRQGRFRIDGVTGPDEYSALQDNNVYTNLMAQRNLRAAADAASRHPREAAELGVGSEEAASWRDAAEAMMVPYDEELGVHPQSEGFTQHEPWDFSTTTPDDYPLLLHFPYFDLYRKQVVKQADLILALHWRGDAFSAEDKARDFAYYEPITVRDSSLSACTQAVVAAEVGHLELAYDYLGEAALMDLADLEHNVRDGLHMGSLAGAWLAVVAGLGGMRDHDGELFFAPRLPQALRDLSFCVCFRGRVLRVVTDHRVTTYSLVSGEALDICHHGETLTIAPDQPVTRPVPESPVQPRPSQPAGREPTRRHD
ncbi:MAG: glycoside hydrolase family 65 protein [Candidatus Dormibacteraeota bacterium]|nr:glycoside hydrolase family 65 protein [Candidatus Dormibacteraeota bacterium]